MLTLRLNDAAAEALGAKVVLSLIHVAVAAALTPVLGRAGA